MKNMRASYLLLIESCLLVVVIVLQLKGPKARQVLIPKYDYLIDFGPLDEKYGKMSRYANKIKNREDIGHMSNEKVNFHQLVPYELNTFLEWKCNSSDDLLAVFNKRKQDFLFQCYINTTYSHCQEFYTILYNSERNVCSSFQREPYLKESFTDVTLITILTLNREDRLPYLMVRWKHRIIISLFLKESDISQAMRIIDQYSIYHRIKFILYIVKEDVSTPYLSVFYDNTGPMYSDEPIFPINVLRDLAVESIETTHYYVSDIDVFASDTLYDTIIRNKKLLMNPRTIFILKSFLMSQKRINHTNCFGKGDCKRIWDMVPHNKSRLIEMYNKQAVVPHPTMRHRIVNVPFMMQSTKTLWRYRATHEMEPYSVIRRSLENPIFHPFFINYGYNKEELLNRMTSMSRCFFTFFIF